MDQDQKNKFFDVAKPGSTAAHAGSKPVIVGNKPLTTDPMVVEQPKDRYGEHQKATLQPISEKLDEEPETNVEPEPTMPPTPLTKKEAKEEEEQAAKELDKLTERQVYFVHIKGARRRRFLSQIILLIGAACASAAIGYYLMTLLHT